MPERHAPMVSVCERTADAIGRLCRIVIAGDPDPVAAALHRCKIVAILRDPAAPDRRQS